MAIKFLRYQGSKEHIISLINNLILINKKYDVYIEPFVGSGTIFINLPDVFDRYIINDIDPNIISMWKAVSYYSYSDYEDALNYIMKTFGDIKNNKQSYYDFREYYNQTYHFTDDIKKGLYLYFLTNSCINSMLRFGPNGMNQGFGNRLYFFSKEDHSFIQKKLKKTKIFNGDYVPVIRGRHLSVIYLDPPYIARPTTYSNTFEEKQLYEMIELILLLRQNNQIIYSDIETKISDMLLSAGFTKISTKNMRNISPLRREEFIEQNEVLYHNIKSKFFI